MNVHDSNISLVLNGKTWKHLNIPKRIVATNNSSGCTGVYLAKNTNKATKDDNEELVQDVLSLFTCFSARLYGKRGGRPKGSKNKKKELVEKLEIGVNDENN